MRGHNRGGLTRRMFVRSAALGAAGLAARPVAADNPPAKAPALSKVAVAQLDALLTAPGKHFTEEEKKDLARMLAALEKTSATLAQFPLVENSDPAVIFRAYRKAGK